MSTPHLPGRRRPVLTLILALLLATPLAGAAEPLLAPATHRALSEVHELLDAGQTAAARGRLQALLPGLAERPYDLAVARQTLAYVHIQSDDYPAAIAALRAALDAGVLPTEPSRRLTYDLAQLLLAEGRLEAGIARLQAWLEQAEAADLQPPIPPADLARALVLLGNAELQREAPQRAIAPLERALTLVDEPQEGWFNLLLGAYHEAGRDQQAAALLQRMLRRFPDEPRYWNQLARVQLGLKQPRQAIVTLELAGLQSHLDADDELLLAQLYLQEEMPAKAARLLQQGLDSGRLPASDRNLELLAHAWLHAREHAQAIPALARAAERSGKGELYLQLAGEYLANEDWSAARRALEQALAQGGLNQPGHAWLMLGHACVELGETAAARRAFREAAGHGGTRRSAQQWLQHLARNG